MLAGSLSLIRDVLAASEDSSYSAMATRHSDLKVGKRRKSHVGRNANTFSPQRFIIVWSVYSAMKNPEFCICAAAVANDGRIIRGHRHNNCLATMAGMGLRLMNGPSEVTQGFITSTGRYVSRKAARALQESAGIASVADGGYRGDELYSEDLY